MVSRDISNLPWILCGPILRKVEPRSVTVFAAFKRQTSVTLVVYEDQQRGDQPDPSKEVLREHAESTVALGKNLHVLAIEANKKPPERSLSSGEIYSYDLKISDPNSSKKSSLSGESLLTGSHPLGYSSRHLPTFSLSPGLQDLNLFHGSCRKPHGHGHDALPVLDSVIADARSDPENRPHQLMLTGDQVYSDDVALALLATLTETGKKLLDWSNPETIPVSNGSTVEPSDTQVQPGPAHRGSFIAEETEYTAGPEYRAGHLVFLREFYTMYLMTWSDVLWPRDDSGNKTLATIKETLGPESERPDVHREGEFIRTQEGYRERAISYASTLPEVRRLLANVPTCMIFDDHEVTDDWYLNRSWEEAVKADDTSRQLVRNGLLAYAIFQDWGNQYDNYAPGEMGNKLLNAVRWSSSGDPPKIINQSDLRNKVLDLRPLSNPHLGPSERMRWDYEIAGKDHKIICLDTRTWRATPSDPDAAAALVGGSSMGFQLDQRQPQGDTLPIIVSPAPVFGNIVAETAQKMKVKSEEKPSADYLYDNEAWISNRGAFEVLLQRLSEFGKSIVLSGDVHYGFSSSVAYFSHRGGSDEKARIVQLCASALHNQGTKTRMLEGVGNPADSMGYFGLGMNSDLEDAAKVLKNEMYPDGQSNTIGGALEKIIFRYVLTEALKEPAVIPGGPWKTKKALDRVRRLVKDPVWEYTVDFLRDNRSGSERVTSFTLPQDFNSWGGVFMQTVKNGARSIIGHNNLGQIRLEAQDGNVVDTAVHRLHWYPYGPDKVYTDYPVFTEHEASLTLPADSEKPEVSK